MDFTIGSRPINQHPFPGTIDEVSLYNTALSATRIAAHYAAATTAGAPVDTITSTLTARASLSASPVRDAHASTSLSASASLSAAPTREQHTAPSLAASASLTSHATTADLAHPSLTATASLTAVAIRSAIANATLSAAATLDTALSRQRVLAVTLDAVATLAASTSAVLHPTLQALASLASVLTDTKPTIDGAIECDWGGLTVTFTAGPTTRDGTIECDWGGLQVHATAASAPHGQPIPAVAPPSYALYAEDGQRWIANLPRAIGSWQDANNDPGSLSIRIPAADCALMLGRRIVKAYWQGEARQGARLMTWKTELAVDGTRWRRYDAQRGLLAMLDDCAVYPEYGFTRAAGDQRIFGFMSGSEPGTGSISSPVFFVRSWWQRPVGLQMSADTGYRKGVPAGMSAADPYWLTFGTTPSDVYTNKDADQVIYLRKWFITREQIDYDILLAADDAATLWIDGQQLITPATNQRFGWKQAQTVSGTFEAGQHMIGIRVANRHGATPIAVAFVLRQLDGKGNPVAPYYIRSDPGSGWLVNDGTGPPSWRPAEVVRTILDENAAFGVHAANQLDPGFGYVFDSNAVDWAHRGTYSFPVGTSLLQVVQQFGDDGIDWAVHPHTMTLQAWQRRGSDKHTTVALQLGENDGNLKTYDVQTTAATINTGLVHLADGTWLQVSDATAVAADGVVVAGLSMGSTRDADTATAQALAILAETANDVHTSTAEPSTLIGALAYRDYQVGDSINVPTEDGTAMMKARVLAISVDATGEVVRAWPEFASDPTP